MAAQKDGLEAVKRDVKQHMLFEVATEVANRGVHSLILPALVGLYHPAVVLVQMELTVVRPGLKLAAFTRSSSPKPLLPPQNMAIDIR